MYAIRSYYVSDGIHFEIRFAPGNGLKGPQGVCSTRALSQKPREWAYFPRRLIPDTPRTAWRKNPLQNHSAEPVVL